MKKVKTAKNILDNKAFTINILTIDILIVGISIISTATLILQFLQIEKKKVCATNLT